MKMKLLVAINLLFCSCVFGAKFPTEIAKCRNDDTACIKKSFTEIMQQYPDGYPAISIPAIDPFHINKLNIVLDGERPLNIRLLFKDLDVFGLSKSETTRISGFAKDPLKSKINFEIKAPKLTLSGQYEIDGRVLILPIQGKGNCNLTLTDVVIRAKFVPEIVTKDGVQHILIGDKFRLAIELQKAQFQFENLFNGDKRLGEHMNLFLNENWREIIDEVLPSFSDAVSQFVKVILNTFFNKFPYNDLWLV